MALVKKSCSVPALILIAAPAAVFAQTDEIQVYDAEIAPKGIFNLMIHTNSILIGRKIADFPNGIIPKHSVNGASEWAYGVTNWFEQGFYLPVYSLYSHDRGATLNAFKIRELFVRPDAAHHRLFYGVNFEFSVNASYWEPKRITSEIRPIIGTHLSRVDLIINPILDTDYTGGFGNLEFAPASRIAYNWNDRWAMALEEYADFGPLRQFPSPTGQFHEVWAVVDHKGKVLSIEAGVGVGMTAVADTLTFKLMVSRDLNPRRGHHSHPNH